MSVGWGPESWVLIVLSGVLALALPLVARKMAARRRVLEELYLSSRPGVVLGGFITLAAFTSGVGVGAVILATVFPVAWATAALCASTVLSIVILAVAYVRAARRRREALIAGEKEERL